MFIIVDNYDHARIADTLQKAFDDYHNEYGIEDFANLTWYEATQIEVQQKVVQLEKTTVSPVRKGK